MLVTDGGFRADGTFVPWPAHDTAALTEAFRRDGPTAGTETVDPLEFLARVVAHLPNKHHVMTRYYGWYANRPRGIQRQAAAADRDRRA